MTAIHTLSAASLADAYAKRALSPVEVATALLDRIERLDGDLTSMVVIDREMTLAMARQSEARWRAGRSIGPLDGVPASVKDLLLMQGYVTRRGTLLTEGAAPDVEDSPSVANLKAAGCVILGKSATTEYGWKGIGDCPLHGPTRNPWSLGHTAGGSSSGAASAVAAGFGPLAIGTDGGGSVRIPSSFTGGVGLKATFGAVPVFPPSPFGQVSHVGPMTRTVLDAALMLDAMSKPDPRDWFPLRADPHAGSFAAGIGQGVKGLKIAYSANLGYAKVDPEVAAAVAEGVKVFQALGAYVEAVDPGFPDPNNAFITYWTAAAAQAMSVFTPEQRKKLDPGLQASVERGLRYSGKDLTQSETERMALGATMARFHKQWDLLITPTMAVTALPVGKDVLEDGPDAYWTDWSPFTIPFNISRQPALTVPCGVSKAGLPIGLQIVGANHMDALVLRAGAAFEAARPFAPSPYMAK